ncbi:hypothetical protein Pcinc_022775 [Petrolisthes cinctipes]|uniref:Transmembrane protein 51 n=1 Tax=Petrolisthes cinctipes TaxID=88211 RepID=A0AAE1KG84_PETCI|nr:hypothetical protein Pcinc_022775 [Petrolisthes cinctipes]
MVLWVVRLSASLGILGGAFLFSGASVLTNSFGQNHRTAQGPGKTSGIVFLAIGCLSLVLSAGLGYYGCRKRKKKEEDECSDSGRALNFTPALSTTADVFPWPSTPSHQNLPSGSPYVTPTVNEPVLASANSGEHKPGVPYSTPAAGEPAFESTYLPPQEEPPPQPGPSSGAGALVRSSQRSRRANAPMLTKQRAVLSTDCYSAASSPVKQEPPEPLPAMDNVAAAAAAAAATAATSRSLDPSSALSPGS